MFYPYEGYRSVTPLDAARVNRTIFHNHYKNAAQPLGFVWFSFKQHTCTPTQWYATRSAMATPLQPVDVNTPAIKRKVSAIKVMQHVRTRKWKLRCLVHLTLTLSCRGVLCCVTPGNRSETKVHPGRTTGGFQWTFLRFFMTWVASLVLSARAVSNDRLHLAVETVYPFSGPRETGPKATFTDKKQIPLLGGVQSTFV